MLLHQLLAATADRFPERTAVEDPDRGLSVSYADFAAGAAGIASALEAAGVAAGDRVGLYAPKSIASVMGVFGVLRTGSAYVPVDPDAPPARNAFIFEDCGVAAVLVEKSRVPKLQAALAGDLREVASVTDAGATGLELVLAVPAPRLAVAVPPAAGPLAYILYTSGSTGKPKGVMHTHASALSFIDWCSDTFVPTEQDKFSSHAPFHFDLSILDIYVPLKHGATLVLISEKLGKQPGPLAEAIARSRITCWYSTPSILRLLVEFGEMETRDYSALRIVNFAGEVFPVKHLRALTEIWSHPRYFNLYGPTETNVCTYYEVELPIPADREVPYPIGYACSGDLCAVMDEHDQPVPAGAEGELYVHGGSVMQGYWNLPARNALAFFEDGAGRAWYKTGDVVRDEGDGCYLFAGRRDRMVKRRGYRVELGEIEAALYKHPAITEAAVLAIPDEENGVRVLACASYNAEAGKKPSLIAMKGFCAKNLPLYMIPDQFHFLETLPKTSTDKIDYQRLKARFGTPAA